MIQDKQELLEFATTALQERLAPAQDMPFDANSDLPVALVRSVADRVYALLQHDLQIMQDRMGQG